jgi:putative transposase
VRHLWGAFGVSERPACRVLGQPRSTQRRVPVARADEPRLVMRMLELARAHPRFGYRRVAALLRREGWRVNRKRVYRLWCRQGLKVPQRRRKRRRLGHSRNGCARRRPRHRGDVWAWDFIHDRTEDGRPLKWLSVVDEYTRECVVLEVRRSLTAPAVIDLLRAAVGERGWPRHIRSDNGPEFITDAIREWLGPSGVRTLYVAPGDPWENGYVESFPSRVRDERLDAELFASLAEARVLAAAWKAGYNHERPHGALGYQTPAEFPRRVPGRTRLDGPGRGTW